MIRFPAVDCALEGFRLTRERPAVVAVWGALLLVSALCTALVSVGSGLQPALAALQSAKTADLAGIDAQAAAVAAHAPALTLLLLIGLTSNVVLYTALLRAVLRPGSEGRSFYLRLGRDEVRQLGLQALFFLLVFAAALVASAIAGAIYSAVLVTAPGAADFVRTLLFAAVACVLIYPMVRLTLAGPMTFDSGRIVLRGAWPLSRGQVGAMLAAYVLAVVMAFLVWLLFTIVVAAVLLAGLMLAHLGMHDLPGWLSPDPSSLVNLLSVHSLFAFLAQAIISILVYVVTMSPAPAIYRALRDTPPAAS